MNLWWSDAKKRQHIKIIVLNLLVKIGWDKKTRNGMPNAANRCILPPVMPGPPANGCTWTKRKAKVKVKKILFFLLLILVFLLDKSIRFKYMIVIIDSKKKEYFPKNLINSIKLNEFINQNTKPNAIRKKYPSDLP